MNRRCRTVAICGTLAFILVSSALVPAQPSRRDSEDSPIKIGLLVPLSGAFAQSGRDILNGFRLYLDEIGYRAAGRAIELVIEDDEGIPAVGLTKAKKLVERDKVHLLAGGVLASTGYALAPYVDVVRIPLLLPIISADDLTQRKRSEWIVRTSWTASQPGHPFGGYAYDVLKLRRVAVIALDYAFGWESVGGFQRTFEGAGGQITQKIWCPVAVHDFAPYLAQIARSNDAVYGVFAGRAALQFMKQYEEFGLKARLPLIAGGTTTDEHVLPFMGVKRSVWSRRFTTVPPWRRQRTGGSRRRIAPSTRRCLVTIPRACTQVADG